MPVHFPPGATASKSKLAASRWREFLFAFHQLTYAIQPALPLRHLLHNWANISTRLAEPPRSRKVHEQRFDHSVLKTS